MDHSAGLLDTVNNLEREVFHVIEILTAENNHLKSCKSNPKKTYSTDSGRSGFESQLSKKLSELVSHFETEERLRAELNSSAIIKEQLQSSIERAGSLKMLNDELTKSIEMHAFASTAKGTTITKLKEENRSLKIQMDHLKRSAENALLQQATSATSSSTGITTPSNRSITKNTLPSSTSMPLSSESVVVSATGASTVGGPSLLAASEHSNPSMVASNVSASELEFFKSKCKSLQIQVSELQQSIADLKSAASKRATRAAAAPSSTASHTTTTTTGQSKKRKAPSKSTGNSTAGGISKTAAITHGLCKGESPISITDDEEAAEDSLSIRKSNTVHAAAAKKKNASSSSQQLTGIKRSKFLL